MKKFLLWFALLLSACASPASSTAVPPSIKQTTTPAPAAAPTKASGTAQPTSASISVLNVQQVKQPDGTIKTTANVSTQGNLGVGQVDLAYPETMLLGNSTSVRLRLSPAQQFVSLTTVAVAAKTPDAPNYVYRLSGNVQLYPLMFAQLRAAAFEIDQKNATSRLIEAGKPAEWVWVIKPTASGRHELLIELSIPIVVNGAAAESSTHVLQDLTMTIQVDAPTPTVAPTRPIFQRINDSIVNNSGAIVAALIGILGTLMGGMFALMNRKK